MQEKIIEIACGLDFVSACTAHTNATIQCKVKGDGSWVSPMRFNADIKEFVYELHTPEMAPDPEPVSVVWDTGKREDEGEEGEEAPQADASAAALTRVDPVDVVSATLEQISGMPDPLSNPLVHLAEAWLAEQPWDWSRPQISPHVAESIGRWVAMRLARVMAQRLACLTSEQPF
jgi:hypothetical protein